jgi:cysteinyl-tRNA synthetase
VDRQRARADKNFAEADRLRDIILKAGYAIEDTPDGPQVRKEK